MAQKFTFYPLGNAETCLLELENGGKLLFDYAAVNDGTSSDPHYDIKEELSAIKEFDVVMFSHPHEDHTKGASEFFYLDHTPKYQSEDRAKIKELWISSAFLLETDLENQSDAKIIRNEARHRLKEGYGIKVFAAPDSLKDWLDEHDIDYDDVCSLIVHAGKELELSDALGEEMQVFVHAPFSDDSEVVDDKNTPSIVLQLRLYNGKQETNLLITGDTPYEVLDRIVEVSQEKISGECIGKAGTVISLELSIPVVQREVIGICQRDGIDSLIHLHEFVSVGSDGSQVELLCKIYVGSTYAVLCLFCKSLDGKAFELGGQSASASKLGELEGVFAFLESLDLGVQLLLG